MSKELEKILERLEQILPPPPPPTDWKASIAFRWRRGTGVLPVWSPDTLPSAIDIGLASPTAVMFGTRSRFPAPYREALFVLAHLFERDRQEVHVAEQVLEARDERAVGAQAQLVHRVVEADELLDVDPALLSAVTTVGTVPAGHRLCLHELHAGQRLSAHAGVRGHVGGARPGSARERPDRLRSRSRQKFTSCSS